MSQAKVDRYKEEKKNRKKTMAKEKRLHLLAVVCGWLVVIALAGWAGVSGYRIYESKKPVEDHLRQCRCHHRLHEFLKHRRITQRTRATFPHPGIFYAILPFFYVRSSTLPSLRRRVPPLASAFSIAFNNTTDVYW